jgi:hypothetical protein
MKNKDQILLEQAYSKVLKEELNPKDFPNTLDPDKVPPIDLKTETEIEFEGNPFWVKHDYEGDVVKIITNLGRREDPDHIVEITPENAPKLFDELSEIAKEKYKEEMSQRNF